MLRPRVPGDPRSCCKDGWTHDLNQYRFLVQSFLQKTSGWGVRTHTPMVVAGPSSLIGRLPAIVGGAAAVRDRGSDLPSLHSCHLILQVAERGPCASSSTFCVPSFPSEALGFSAGDFRVLTVTAFAVFNPTFPVYTWFHFSLRLKNVCKQGSYLIWPVGDAEKSVDKLSVKELCQRFCIPNGVLVELMDGEAVSTEKAEDNAIIFSNEQFKAGLRFPLPPSVNGMQRSQPAFQLGPLAAGVTGFNEGRSQGTCVGPGCLGWSSGASERPFSPNHSLVLPGPNKRGCVVEWVEKASFARLNKKLPKTVVPGKHYILKDLPFYKEVQKADAQNVERSLTIERGGEKREPCERPLTKNGLHPLFRWRPSEEEEEESEVLPLPSVSSGFGRFAGLNHSGPSLSVAGCLALVAEEATSINQPDSPHPDADVARAPCAVALPPMVPAMEEMGQKVKRSGDGSREPPAPVVVPDGDSPEATQPTETDRAPDSEEESLSNASSGGNPVDDAACISASAFCYAELEEKLKRIPPGLDVAMPSAKSLFFYLVCFSAAGERSSRHGQQHDLFFDLLRTADYMKAFTSQRRNSEEELRLRLEQAETSLSAARNENEGFRMELAEAKSREETLDARLLEAEDEKALLRGNVRQLRTEVSIKKKQREDLQLRYQRKKKSWRLSLLRKGRNLKRTTRSK
ncbi:hypothetical protein CK203_019418 [Vitis vinifera]|uniref:Uncharacterized protein n=1 Tax=Vitis vinifera TaxID=29760 RepID=A0A438IZ91_VITVI|nr:hypothetical protein CK203_019418 [Vitis vinifera]